MHPYVLWFEPLRHLHCGIRTPGSGLGRMLEVHWRLQAHESSTPSHRIPLIPLRRSPHRRRAASILRVQSVTRVLKEQGIKLDHIRCRWKINETHLRRNRHELVKPRPSGELKRRQARIRCLAFLVEDIEDYLVREASTVRQEFSMEVWFCYYWEKPANMEETVPVNETSQLNTSSEFIPGPSHRMPEPV